MSAAMEVPMSQSREVARALYDAIINRIATQISDIREERGLPLDGEDLESKESNLLFDDLLSLLDDEDDDEETSPEPEDDEPSECLRLSSHAIASITVRGWLAELLIGDSPIQPDVEAMLPRGPDFWTLYKDPWMVITEADAKEAIRRACVQRQDRTMHDLLRGFFAAAKDNAMRRFLN